MAAALRLAYGLGLVALLVSLLLTLGIDMLAATARSIASHIASTLPAGVLIRAAVGLNLAAGVVLTRMLA